jgi:hypothetical protein
MGNTALLFSVLAVVVAAVALLIHANFMEVIALVIAFFIVLITFSLAEPTFLSSGTRCPGAFGGAIIPGYDVLQSDQWLVDRQECQRLVDEDEKKVLGTWIVGGIIFLVCLILGRADRKTENACKRA